jgi:aspartate 4-decarboxylase
MRRRIYLALIVFLGLAITLGGCTVPQADTAEPTSNSVHERLEKELGAFDITAEQRELAKSNEAGYEPLDAGRGNPNWINAKARSAFARLMEFAIAECQHDMSEGDMAGHGVAEGVAERFDAAMDPADETDKFLIDAVAYCVNELGMNKQDLLMELTNGIIGDYYPSPSRCLALTEDILNEYLQDTLYDGVDLKGETQVFPTEGGSAAMCYVFQSLNHNRVLSPGDKIAIATPIFTPYL